MRPKGSEEWRQPTPPRAVLDWRKVGLPGPWAGRRTPMSLVSTISWVRRPAALLAFAPSHLLRQTFPTIRCVEAPLFPVD